MARSLRREWLGEKEAGWEVEGKAVLEVEDDVAGGRRKKGGDDPAVAGEGGLGPEQAGLGAQEGKAGGVDLPVQVVGKVRERTRGVEEGREGPWKSGVEGVGEEKKEEGGDPGSPGSEWQRMRKKKDRKRRREEDQASEASPAEPVGAHSPEKRRRRTGDSKRWRQWAGEAGEGRYRVRRKGEAQRRTAGKAARGELKRRVPRRRRKKTSDRRRRKEEVPSRAAKRETKGRTWRGRRTREQRARRQEGVGRKERGGRREVKRWAERPRGGSGAVTVSWRDGELLGPARKGPSRERARERGLVEARRRHQVSKRVRGTKRGWAGRRMGWQRKRGHGGR